jgi:hypothetical protein
MIWEIMMDWSRLVTILAISFVVFISGLLIGMFKMIYAMHKDVKILKNRSSNARDENVMQFSILRMILRSIRLIIKCLKTGKINGELEDIEKEVKRKENKMIEYLQDSIH